MTQSKEFCDLGESTRRMLETEGTPHFEIISVRCDFCRLQSSAPAVQLRSIPSLISIPAIHLSRCIMILDIADSATPLPLPADLSTAA